MKAARLISVLLAAIGAGAVAAVDADASGRPPARMLVDAQEWSLWPSRTALPAGRVIVQLWNRGQDAHDLRIRRLNGRGQMTGRAQSLSITYSGAIGQASWRLRRGRYQLYCSMPGHMRRGMHATLVVR